MLKPTRQAAAAAASSETISEATATTEDAAETEGKKEEKGEEKKENYYRKRKGEGLLFWPAKFSGPFMFLPEYVEVNYPTCSAVLLRKPQWRSGRTEIPSPYPPQLHALAHEFYARHRRP